MPLIFSWNQLANSSILPSFFDNQSNKPTTTPPAKILPKNFLNASKILVRGLGALNPILRDFF